MQMLDWFIKEQGEEEKNAADLITKMELFGGDSKGLYMLNGELKTRVYTAPALVLSAPRVCGLSHQAKGRLHTGGLPFLPADGER